MTATTVRTKFSVVNIIRPVAVRAAIARLLHRRKRTAVTAIAGDLDMRAMQFEIRLRIVIKQPQVPSDRVMAHLTVVLENAMMGIVVVMATGTIAASVGELLCGMAVVALDFVMLAK